MGMENMLFNGLLKYASGSGDAGAKLVGDLATEVPVPTNNGLTYTFHLRHGRQVRTTGQPRRDGRAT